MMYRVSSMISGVMSMGIVAGFVSGLYYLVVAGIRWAGKLVTSLGEQGEKCNCCGDTLSNPSTRKCSVCARQREVKLQSGEWFYRQLQSRFNRPAITNNNYSVAHKDGAGMDPESTQVREFIERLVEALVSGQLDDVKVNRLFTHPEYDRMFACHHTPLCEKLVRLSFALQMAIANKPVPDDETPSAVHAALKQQIQRILQEAMALPNLQNKVSNENGNAVHHWDEDITTKTYEDILATAILNKVIQQFQQRNRNSTRFTEATLEDTLDSNKNILQNSDMEEQNMPKFISTVEIGVNGSGNLTGTNISTNGDRSWITSSSDNPMSMTIEECIEEVTTYDSVGEEEESSEDLTTSAGTELDFYLSGLNFIKQRRVPFPEFGMDIIDGSKEANDDNEAKAEQQSDSSESPHPTDLVTPIDSWEENWLFQRRRLKTGTMAGNSQGMPVPMLVPNPSEDFRALIGDRDAEEVSDLSDCSDAALEDIVLADVELGNKVTTSLVQDVQQDNSCANENNLRENITVKAFSRTEAINTDNSRGEQLLNDNKRSQEEHCSMDSDKNIFESTTDEMEASSLELNKASSVECLSEFGQQDSEYTEDYASVTQRQLNSLIRLRESDVSPTPLPVPKPRSQQKQAQLENTVDENQQNQRQSEETSDIHVNESNSLESPPKPGTIAEREHRKWESAPPLPNNPYSPENISKRLSRKSLYSVSSASSRSSSVDFPELNGESVVSNTVAEPLHIICTSGDPDYKRYGRDYYINQSKSASGERKSHSRLSSPSSPALQQQYHQVFSSPENNVSRTKRVEKTRSMDNICLPSGLVENEVAKWQKEINQIEQRWLKKLHTNKAEDKDSNAGNAKHASESNNPQLLKEEELTEVTAKANETSDDTSGTDNVDSIMNGTRPSVKAIKASLEGCKQERDENHYFETENNHSVDNKSKVASAGNVKKCNDASVQQAIITNGHISRAENGEQTTAKSKQKPERPTRLQVREWKNLSHGSENLPLNENPWRRTPSECSTVSSDLDLDADVPIVLPSVKELAKHFSSDSDSSLSAPKGKSSTQRRMRNSNELHRGKPVIIVEKSKQQHMLSPRCHQPVREVHSLTARSISRQFREGLRQNLPAHFDRNLHTQGGKLSDSGVQSVSSVISSCAENDNDNFDNSMSDGPEVTLSKSTSMPVVLAQNEKFQSSDYGKKFSYLKNRISANNSKTAFLDNADISIGSVNSVYPHHESPMKYRVASYGNLSTNSDMDIGFKFRSEDTTPGYTSDESGAASPIPPPGGRRKLHSSIAFWEQLQQNSK